MTTLGYIEFIDLGSFPASELPDPIEYTFLDADGNVIALTGASNVVFRIERSDNNGITAFDRTGVDVSGLAAGKVTYQLTADDMLPGHYEARFSLSLAPQLFISHRLRWWTYEDLTAP